MKVEEHVLFERRCQILGWALFILSAAFFMATSWVAGDPIGFTGGTLFFVACFVFLAPFVYEPQRVDTSN